MFFRPLRRKNVPLERIVEGTSLSVAALRSRSGRMDWAEMCTVLRNLRTHFSEEDLVETGREMFRARPLRYGFVIARLLLSPMGFYRWLNTPRAGAGNQLFTCVRPS